jgi:hypothetical protein
MAARKNHFTARLVVEEVVFAENGLAVDRRHSSPPPSPSRDVLPVAEIVFRADSLDALASKLAAHTALLGDS